MLKERKIRSLIIDDQAWYKLRMLSIIKKEATSEIVRNLIDVFLEKNQKLISDHNNSL